MVVDDFDMGITHVIRVMIMSTIPKDRLICTRLWAQLFLSLVILP
ncbi:hypothetical protein [Anaerobiospirillum thomasii]